MTVKTKIIASSCLVFPFKRHRPRFLSAPQDAGTLYGQYNTKRRPPQPNKKETSKRMSLFCWCERWDLNPHDLTDTSTSSLPVCRFQHARERNLRYYNKMPLFVKRLPEKLPESFASRLHRHKYLRNPRLWAKEKTLEALWLQGFSCWCARRDLNPHARNEH